MALNKLKAKTVEHQRKPGRYSDGGGLYLQITSAGTRSWVFRYREPTAREQHCKIREMGLGSVDDVAMAEARELRREMLGKIAKGIDPITERKENRATKPVKPAPSPVEPGGPMTFRRCADLYIEARRAGWKNEKHAKQWAATLQAYAHPIIGNVPLCEIDTALVLKVLNPIWTVKPETASRVRSRMERILSWARLNGHRPPHSENPARWEGHLDEAFDSPKTVKPVEHHPAMPYADVPGFTGALRASPYVSARALEFTILAAVRTNETICAEWSEIDLKAATWVIPASRMKARREHRVPLCARAVEILREMADRQEAGFVFPGARANKPLSNMAMLSLLKQRYPNLTVHGFRSSFRDWSAEETDHDKNVVEMALAHTIGNKVEASYRRGDLWSKRRRLMDDWAAYCAGQVQEQQAAA